jgi:hypothetical protein
MFVLALAPLGTLIGCITSPPPPVVLPGAYTGPGVELSSDLGMHVAVFSAPTPGWVPSLDRVMDGPGARNVFISLREPNPTNIRAQVVVPQRVATGIPQREPVRIHTRTLRWDDEDLEDIPYRVAAGVAAMAGPR